MNKEENLKPKRLKIFTISDLPISNSGIAKAAYNMITGLLDTGKYEVVSFGCAISHKNKNPIQLEKYKELWTIFPIEGFGTQDLVRSMLQTQKPDIMLYIGDPRFFYHVFEMAPEIREAIPLVFYSIWDNGPAPMFNYKHWASNDKLVAMTELTHQFFKEVTPEVDSDCVKLSIDTDIFVAKPETDRISARERLFGKEDNKFNFLFVNRNCRRKLAGSLIYWFKDVVDKLGKDNVRLICHTHPTDPVGQNLYEVMKASGLTSGEVVISGNQIGKEDLSMLYNVSDAFISISDAEGHGLTCTEAMACEIPVIISLTGGLIEQSTHKGEPTGIGIEPVVKNLVGSLDVPYIYEDRISKESMVDACVKIYNSSPEERRSYGKVGRSCAIANYSLPRYVKQWDKVLQDIHNKYGSWSTRKNYKPYTVETL